RRHAQEVQSHERTAGQRGPDRRDHEHRRADHHQDRGHGVLDAHRALPKKRAKTSAPARDTRASTSGTSRYDGRSCPTARTTRTTVATTDSIWTATSRSP